MAKNGCSVVGPSRGHAEWYVIEDHTQRLGCEARDEQANVCRGNVASVARHRAEVNGQNFASCRLNQTPGRSSGRGDLARISISPPLIYRQYGQQICHSTDQTRDQKCGCSCHTADEHRLDRGADRFSASEAAFDVAEDEQGDQGEHNR